MTLAERLQTLTTDQLLTESAAARAQLDADVAASRAGNESKQFSGRFAEVYLYMLEVSRRRH